MTNFDLLLSSAPKPPSPYFTRNDFKSLSFPEIGDFAGFWDGWDGDERLKVMVALATQCGEEIGGRGFRG